MIVQWLHLPPPGWGCKELDLFLVLQINLQLTEMFRQRIQLTIKGRNLQAISIMTPLQNKMKLDTHLKSEMLKPR